MSNVNVNKVKEIMQKCSMPLELTMGEFKAQARDMDSTFRNNIEFDLLKTKEEIINWSRSHFGWGISLDTIKELVQALLERYDKPSTWISNIREEADMFYLIRHGLVFISEEERRQKAEGSPQYIDELFGALNDIVTNSQQELKELEEERDKLVEEINQKRKQMLQGIEALRSRLAELGAECDNILPQKDERIREME